MCTLSKE